MRPILPPSKNIFSVRKKFAQKNHKNYSKIKD